MRCITHALAATCVAAMTLCAHGADAGHVSDYQVDYTNTLGITNYREVLLPPARYKHAPSVDVEVQEVAPETLATVCRDRELQGCIIRVTKFSSERHHRGDVCFKGRRPYVCSVVWYQTGDKIGEVNRIYIPRVGDRVHGIEITATYQSAILLHEIGHANGWTAEHER